MILVNGPKLFRAARNKFGPTYKQVINIDHVFRLLLHVVQDYSAKAMFESFPIQFTSSETF